MLRLTGKPESNAEMPSRWHGPESKALFAGSIHPIIVTNPPTTQRSRTTRFLRADFVGIPKSRQTIITAPKRTTHAFLRIVTLSLPHSRQAFIKFQHGHTAYPRQ